MTSIIMGTCLVNICALRKHTLDIHAKNVFLFLFLQHKMGMLHYALLVKNGVGVDINLGYTHSELSKGIPVYVHPKKIHIFFPFKAILITFIN